MPSQSVTLVGVLAFVFNEIFITPA